MGSGRISWKLAISRGNLPNLGETQFLTLFSTFFHLQETVNSDIRVASDSAVQVHQSPPKSATPDKLHRIRGLACLLPEFAAVEYAMEGGKKERWMYWMYMQANH